MGKKFILCGGPGAGCVTKLCNNLSLAISMVGTSEALALGSKMGLDPKLLADVMNASTAR
jgi:3-hydroxyisobutyrate dehydrogenase